ncbi:SusC/RagA family TonB-linked outer membrane protein [Parapedobacter sp. 10938]|uniref:SusC/RagA family TonB-linked outer membrane protein n=1 Tax=Parapedobacter flavus TaxID=3110225 RepID=UPI002DB61FEC|nr:SusC/RagA family TonB-linked outer membrane protein [Parapedobacter sp. 10938]MEC3879138.1 SusC/RagA family TonB-linked outer membrane protein [Parapedobacter sp. 10938]
MERKIYLILLISCTSLLSLAQERLAGIVINAEGNALAGVGIHLIGSGRGWQTDASGNFLVTLSEHADTLVFTHVGYKRLAIPSSSLSESKGPAQVILERTTGLLEEVMVNTGYYSLPRERATGSFSYIDEEMLNRSVGTDILGRLENITSGLLFDRRALSGEDVDGSPELRVRGINTIESNSAPLIVVDNFPFEGEISDINPNDVASVTVLRDAAASSIWGARAGNGVIVITTKKGKYNQPARISFSGNVNITDKPNLFYGRNYLPSPTVMEIQQDLFQRGGYTENDLVQIPGYVELLIRERDGTISPEEFLEAKSEMERTDLREQSLRYLYREAVAQQYALGIQGGGGNYTYSFSAGLDRNAESQVRNNFQRASIGIQNGFKIRPNLELEGSFWYTKEMTERNGQGFYSNIAIYEGLVDRSGQPRSIWSVYRRRFHEQAPDRGLLDWVERPLDELRLRDISNGRKHMRFNGNLKYDVLEGLSLSGAYQFSMGESSGKQYHDKDSYFVRDLVNRFTDPTTGARVIPYGSIMDYQPTASNRSHSGRLQANLMKDFHDTHTIAALAGAEVRQAESQFISGQRIYDFDPQLWTGVTVYDYLVYHPRQPSGSGRIPNTSFSPDKSLNRHISYFSNFSYTYYQRYILSGSARWDGSNLLGVKTNQRGTALWSMGGSWEISREGFYHSKWMPYLRVRTTYGSAGNIDKSQSYYPTIHIQSNPVTNGLQADLYSPGNPSLRWEQVNTLNVGLDWAMANSRINGSLEYYDKESKYLLGPNLMDPTTGIPLNSPYKMNYGNMRTWGWDAQITSRNLVGPLSWSSTLLVSHSENKITQLNRPVQNYASTYVNGGIPEKGKSVDILYAYPWYGLDGNNGLPMVYVDGEPTTGQNSYGKFILGIEYNELVNAGTVVPPIFGSLRNVFTWQGLQLDFLLSFKFGHVFRRSSIGPGQEFLRLPVYHMDYFNRWKEPGDEKETDVPAALPANNIGLSEYYLASTTLIEKGGSLRLQDVGLRYSLPGKFYHGRGIQRFTCFLYARNLGILWRANDLGLDPDYPNTSYPAPRSIAFGVQVAF